MPVLGVAQTWCEDKVARGAESADGAGQERGGSIGRRPDEEGAGAQGADGSGGGGHRRRPPAGLAPLVRVRVAVRVGVRVRVTG